MAQPMAQPKPRPYLKSISMWNTSVLMHPLELCHADDIVDVVPSLHCPVRMRMASRGGSCVITPLNHRALQAASEPTLPAGAVRSSRSQAGQPFRRGVHSCPAASSSGPQREAASLAASSGAGQPWCRMCRRYRCSAPV